MRKINISRYATMYILVISMLMMYACTTEEEEAPFTEQETGSYESAETLEHSFDVVEAITNAGMEYVESENSGRTTVDQEIVCAKLTLSGTSEDGMLEINFGTNGCEGPNGKIRRGKIVIEWLGKRFSKGSTVNTLLKGFYVDDMKIEGTRKVTNVSESLSNPSFEVEVLNGKVVWADSTYSTWNANRVQDWTIADNNFTISITGSANGISRRGNAYTSEITSPLIIESKCLSQRNYLPSKGEKYIATEDIRDIIIDYGEGACDQAFTVWIGSISKEVYL